MKLIYEKIKERITEITEIKTVLLDNSQFEDATANISTKTPLLYPAVLISFQDISYRTDTKNIQRGSMTVRVRLGCKSLNNEDLTIFDVRDLVQEKLQGYNEIDLFEKLLRVSEAQDTEHGILNIWEMNYSCEFTDLTAFEERLYTEILITPDVTKDEVRYLIP